MITRALKSRRRRQGMTEYIILVGLIAIVLVTAISNYRQAVNDVIVGSDGGGMVGATNNVTNGISAVNIMGEEDDE